MKIKKFTIDNFCFLLMHVLPRCDVGVEQSLQSSTSLWGQKTLLQRETLFATANLLIGQWSLLSEGFDNTNRVLRFEVQGLIFVDNKELFVNDVLMFLRFDAASHIWMRLLLYSTITLIMSLFLSSSVFKRRALKPATNLSWDGRWRNSLARVHYQLHLRHSHLF